MDCDRCGKCCDTYSFAMTNKFFDDDPMEIKRLIEYHNCVPVRSPNPNGKDFLGIRIPQTCIHLEMKDGKSSCKIHNNKPKVCKDYYCQKVINKFLKREFNGFHV